MTVKAFIVWTEILKALKNQIYYTINAQKEAKNYQIKIMLYYKVFKI